MPDNNYRAPQCKNMLWVPFGISAVTAKDSPGPESPSEIAFERLIYRLKQDKDLPAELTTAFIADLGSVRPHEFKNLREQMADDST